MSSEKLSCTPLLMKRNKRTKQAAVLIMWKSVKRNGKKRFLNGMERVVANSRQGMPINRQNVGKNVYFGKSDPKIIKSTVITATTTDVGA